MTRHDENVKWAWSSHYRPTPLDRFMEDSHLVNAIQKGLKENGVLSCIRGKIWREVAAAGEVPSGNEGLEIFIRKILETSCWFIHNMKL